MTNGDLRTMQRRPSAGRRQAFAAATGMLAMVLLPGAALAVGPATVATCEGIKAAYDIIGTQCVNAYAKIGAVNTAAARLATFKARQDVLIAFRKAYLCNGLAGAKKDAQQKFIAGEDGHVTQLQNVRTAMTTAGDPNIPAMPDLAKISINQQQCK